MRNTKCFPVYLDLKFPLEVCRQGTKPHMNSQVPLVPLDDACYYRLAENIIYFIQEPCGCKVLHKYYEQIFVFDMTICNSYFFEVEHLSLQLDIAPVVKYKPGL